MSYALDMKSPKQRAPASFNGEVPPVSAFEMGFAFTFFRRAALDELREDLSHPLSDEYAVASLSEEGFERGMMILAVHYDRPDTPTPTMKRIESFVQILQSMTASPDKLWTDFCGDYDRFVPIVYAMAWCPVRPGCPFAIAEFMWIARNAPLTISQAASAFSVS